MPEMRRSWWHGTSDDAGLEDGDLLDPARGQYEPAVWATSSRDAAWRYARDTAVAVGGNPVVFRVHLAPRIRVVRVTPRGADAAFRHSIADALLFERSEYGADILAILRRGVASVEGPEWSR